MTEVIAASVVEVRGIVEASVGLKAAALSLLLLGTPFFFVGDKESVELVNVWAKGEAWRNCDRSSIAGSELGL